MKRRRLLDLTNNPPLLATVGEVSTFLRLDRRTVRKLIDAGQLEAYQFGTDIRIPLAALRQFVEASRVPVKRGVTPTVALREHAHLSTWSSSFQPIEKPPLRLTP